MAAMNHAFILTLSCPDRTGIVHAVSGFLLERGGNIEEAAQYNDHDTGLFFMRVQFACDQVSEADLRSLDLHEPLRACLTWDQLRRLDQLVPAHFETPLGRKVPIDYDGEAPAIEVRLQEMFGVTRHPVVGAKQLPLRVTLTSPGHKTIQVTMDIPRFWTSSYADVRKDMRGQYPRHPWPEDPTQAEPTLRAKPRGT